MNPKNATVNIILALFALLYVLQAVAQNGESKTSFFGADNKLIQYVGRIDFRNPKAPQYWQPGVYVKARFTGTFCHVVVEDEMLWGKNHNYLQIVVDDTVLYRVQTKKNRDTIRVVTGLSNGPHTIVVAKNTEANIGYLRFLGLQCNQLLSLPSIPERKMEFIGNSITCGTGADQSEVACGEGVWQDQHNAYLAYGPVTARALQAQWMLSSVSGIGLVHSCCNMDVVMPQVYANVNLRDIHDSLTWNFNNYQPDVVTVCLGQNDGIQDSLLFCTAYVQFVQQVRDVYPQASIICLTSPMADSALAAVQRRYLTGIVSHINRKGDSRVHPYFFSKQYSSGCDSHPNLHEHAQIAAELTAYVKKVMHW